MTYQEVNPSFWKYEKDGDFVEGILVRVQHDVGVNESNLYTVETSEGMKSVWGSTILDEKMALVHEGDKVKLTFKGLTEASKGKKPAKIFKVEVDKQLG